MAEENNNGLRRTILANWTTLIPWVLAVALGVNTLLTRQDERVNQSISDIKHLVGQIEGLRSSDQKTEELIRATQIERYGQLLEVNKDIAKNQAKIMSLRDDLAALRDQFARLESRLNEHERQDRQLNADGVKMK